MVRLLIAPKPRYHRRPDRGQPDNRGAILPRAAVARCNVPFLMVARMRRPEEAAGVRGCRTGETSGKNRSRRGASAHPAQPAAALSRLRSTIASLHRRTRSFRVEVVGSMPAQKAYL